MADLSAVPLEAVTTEQLSASWVDEARSFLAGFLQERIGWIALNWASMAIVTVSLLAVVWLARQRTSAPAVA